MEREARIDSVVDRLLMAPPDTSSQDVIFTGCTRSSYLSSHATNRVYKREEGRSAVESAVGSAGAGGGAFSSLAKRAKLEQMEKSDSSIASSRQVGSGVRVVGGCLGNVDG